MTACVLHREGALRLSMSGRWCGIQKEADNANLDMETFEEACCDSIRDSERFVERGKERTGSAVSNASYQSPFQKTDERQKKTLHPHLKPTIRCLNSLHGRPQPCSPTKQANSYVALNELQHKWQKSISPFNCL
jgi:hypothetical protein